MFEFDNMEIIIFLASNIIFIVGFYFGVKHNRNESETREKNAYTISFKTNNVIILKELIPKLKKEKVIPESMTEDEIMDLVFENWEGYLNKPMFERS